MLKAHNASGTEKYTYEDIENLDLHYENPNLLSVKKIMKYYGLTYDLDYVLIHNKSNYEFLTSGYPTIVYNLFSNVHNLFSGWGMSSGGISPLFAIMLYDSCAYDFKINNGIIEIKQEKDINEINKLTMLNSEFCVQGSKNIPHNYLKHLKKGLTLKKYSPLNILGDNVNNTLIAIHRKRLNYTAKFSFLKINKKYNTIPIPLNAAGIIRPQSKKMNEFLDVYWKQKEEKYDQIE